MLKNNAINLLGTFTILALSFLFLARAAPPAPAGAEPTAVPDYEAGPADAVVIQALPADAIIIEALPAND